MGTNGAQETDGGDEANGGIQADIAENEGMGHFPNTHAYKEEAKQEKPGGWKSHCNVYNRIKRRGCRKIIELDGGTALSLRM